jgi:hypothetical protein
MSAMKEHIEMTMEAIDDVFGDGYAKKNPELVGRLIQGEMIGFGMFQISEAVHALAEPEPEMPGPVAWR